MAKLGFHVSIAGSMDLAVGRAQALGCDTFQMFTRSPRLWNAKPISEGAAEAFKKAVRESGIGPVVDHMPYLPNPAAEKPDVYEKSVATLTEELTRCAQLNIPYLVTHLGHHGPVDGHDKGLEKTVQAIGYALDHSEGNTMILLENTANEKNTVGGTFADVGKIADGLGREPRVGFCFDTCHAGAAGYDLKGFGAETVFGWFNDEAGSLDRLKVIHLNDMKGGVGSHLDRHEHLGLGFLGEETIRDILTWKGVAHCAYIMETPVNETRSDVENMEVARRLST
jgi:apurinic endonuclease (APN1)